jgi:Tfp pilus assembly protein PilX
MIRRVLSRFRNERGQSLVIALLVMTFLAIALGAVMIFTAGNQRNANIQKAQQVAGSLAEAGINNAVSVLSQAAVPGNAGNAHLIPPAGGGNSTLMPSSWATANSNTYSGGTVQWYGTVNSSWLWTLHAKATVANPTGAAAIVKYMSAKVQVNAPLPTTYQIDAWNTIYSPFGPTPGQCDTSFGQGVTISVPVYVGGNLCMGQNSVITKPVYVGGYLYFQNKQSSIGTSGSPVSSAHVGGYCQVQNNGTQVYPCKSEPTNPHTNVWVTGAPTDLRGPASDFAGIAAPTICWGPGTCPGDVDGGWYTVSSPGPLSPCTTSSGTPPTFDNDSTMNNSVLTTFNLTPSSSYTCKTAQGELSWNAATNVLTVAGTVFIDGSATVSGTATYTGWGSNGACTNDGDCEAVLYLSGDFSMKSSTLCAIKSGNSCNWNAWDPNKKMLIIAANGLNGVSITTTSQFQGGLYATNTVSTGQQSTTEGPLVSGTQIVSLGQQAGGTFPPVTILPRSIQEPPGGFWISPPTNFCNGTGC